MNDSQNAKMEDRKANTKIMFNKNLKKAQSDVNEAGTDLGKINALDSSTSTSTLSRTGGAAGNKIAKEKIENGLE